MFKIHSGVEKWGKTLLRQGSRKESADLVANPIKTQFDLFYLFFLVGVLAGRQPQGDVEYKDIVRTYPEAYTEYRYIMAGLLLATELAVAGVPIDRKQAQRKVIDLLRSDSATFLSSDAIEVMNGYAAGGFQLVQERLPVAPGEPHDFLLWFHNEMIPYCVQNSQWIGSLDR
jgi:hypothetical protein